MSSIADLVYAALGQDDVVDFVRDYFPGAGPTLFIGNVGFSRDVDFYPRLLASSKNVDFRFLFEQRPDVPKVITEVANRRQQALVDILGERMRIESIDICAPDGAPVGGRNACKQVAHWLAETPYRDLVLDATGMSRGTCFPIAKQLIEHARKVGARVHLLVADSSPSGATVRSVSGDRGDWIHGFHGEVDTDAWAEALRLWVVQLTENSDNVLSRLFTDLGMPSEVCPIVPFPSADPRRGDRLLFELRSRWLDDWGETPLNLIYAHEADPTDVYWSISQLHTARQQSLAGAGVSFVTILSPLGRRLPSIGMLLAALEFELPLYYLETVGYSVSGVLPMDSDRQPEHLWCFRFPHFQS